MYFVTYRFIGEETTAETNKKIELTVDPTWIIDPVDGTMNFVHKFPHVCISIALLIEKTTEIGIIYNPILDQLFTARRGKGAFLNGKTINVSQETGNIITITHNYLWFIFGTVIIIKNPKNHKQTQANLSAFFRITKCPNNDGNGN